MYEVKSFSRKEKSIPPALVYVSVRVPHLLRWNGSFMCSGYRYKKITSLPRTGHDNLNMDNFDRSLVNLYGLIQSLGGILGLMHAFFKQTI